MHFTTIETTLIVILTALIVSVVFRSIHLPVLLGYLVVGTVVGPHVLGWASHTQDIKELAEFGVALLMFTVGLEFSLPKLIALRSSVFLLGGSQVLISILITMLIGWFIKMSWIESMVVGCVVAMSSTAIVIKQLSEQFEVHSKHGLNAVGILLFQDLAVIPILVLIASLSGTADPAQVPTIISWALLKGLVAIIAIIGIGRWLLKPLFHRIAATRTIELFTLSVLFIALGSAWFTQAMGISYALGAFLAGIMLGETAFKHQINIEIRPFRDVLLGVFFVSIGMLVNVTTWLDTWKWIALLLLALMIGKAILITALCYLSKRDLKSATRTGVILSQGGEFGFAILTVALANQLLPPDYGQVVLTTLLITFALAPIIIQHNATLARFLLPRRLQHDPAATDKAIKTTPAQLSQLSQHVIICGYGRVGQNIARLLSDLHYPYVGLDLDPEIIRHAQLAGDCVIYGNATHLDLLKAAQLHQAAALVISFSDPQAAISIIQQTRHIQPQMPLLVRCKDDAEFKILRQAGGATQIVTEAFETSLSLTHHLLQLLHIPNTQIATLLQKTRDKNYTLLSQVFPSTLAEVEAEAETLTASGTGTEALHEYLRPIPLPETAAAVRQPLRDTLHNLSSAQIPVEVIAIRRGDRHLKPTDDLTLQAGDILILFGPSSHLDAAEEVLLVGR